MKLVPLLATIALAACAATPRGPAAPPERSASETPTPAAGFRATLEASGYATILDAPPAPFTPTEPTPPPPLTPAQLANHAQFARVGQFQNGVREQVQALSERLEREQRGNFVSVYYDNEGDPSVVFQFLRDGPGTLRRYTQHSRFFGKTVPWSMARLMADQDFVMKAFAADRVIQGAGIGRNEVNVGLLVSEAEFRALVARKGVTLPESVVLEFRAAPVVPLLMPDPAAALDAPVPAEVARRIRIFARDDRPNGLLHSIASTAKVVLRDGCFRLADHGDALALFPQGARLFIDSEGYLAFGAGPEPGYARVGETLIFTGSITAVTAPELVAPLHAACGPGKVIKITALDSLAARNSQAARDDQASALRRLRDEYGLSAAQARRALVYLDAQQAGRPRQTSPDGVPFPPVSAAMIVGSPPPPVANGADCPAGSKLSFGLCRTPEGYLRPLPAWLAEFLAQDR